jgi:hypothetical protein
MDSSTKFIQCDPDPFFIESIEPKTDLPSLQYHGRGEPVYANGRQVMVRACHDGLISCLGEKGRGIVLVMRDAEPARGYLWALGGFYNRGVETSESFVSRIQQESGLTVEPKSLRVLGHGRFMWNTTPHKMAKELGLPLGIDDTGMLFYGEGNGELKLDFLHKNPVIVTPEMYTLSFRDSLHPYIQLGMDRVIPLISKS